MPQGPDDDATDSPWWTLFDEEDAKPPRRRVRLPLRVVIGIACSVCVAVTVAVWPAGDTAPSPTASTTAAESAIPPTAAAADPAADELLRQRLPSGYPNESCSAGPAADGPATLTCGPGEGPDAPTSATFTLLTDRSALQAALDDVVARLVVQDCPGRIQSPGPWRASGNPEPRGMLVCGTSDAVPVIAWTDQTTLTLNLIRSDRGGPTVDELFRWWGTQA